MKTNNSQNNNLVTKENLDSALKLTKQELNQTIKTTKQKQTKEFSELVNNILIDIGIKFGEQDSKFKQIDKRFEQVDQRFDQIDKRFDKLSKDILDGNLIIIGELKSMKEEMVVANYRQKENSIQLEKNGLRISTLEDNCLLSTK